MQANPDCRDVARPKTLKLVCETPRSLPGTQTRWKEALPMSLQQNMALVQIQQVQVWQRL